MAEPPESGRRAADGRSHIGYHERSADGETRADQVFHPSNGDVTHIAQALDNQTVHTHRQVDGIVDGMYVKLPF